MRRSVGPSGHRELAATIALGILLSAAAGPGSAVADSAAADGKTLRAAALLFRHDVISPKYKPPKVETEWPMGFQQLTAIGIRRTYASGQALRRKYVEQLALVSARYKMPEIYFRASNTDRALQTAQVLALGLFPLGTGPDPSVFDKKLEAAPTPQLAFAAIPIHSASLEHDNVLRPWTGQASCTKYRRFLKVLPGTKLYREQAQRFAPFLKRIAAVTGYNEGKDPAKILSEINEIHEPLLANVEHNLPLPKDISEKDMELLSRLSDWNYHYQFFGKKIGRVTGGSFVGEVRTNFAKFIKASGDARKLFIYSGHQRGMLGVDAALGIETARTEGPFFKGRIPPLGSHYAFELHERKTGEYSIRLNFVTDNAEKTITIPGCDGAFCSFDRFQEIAAEVAPTNWRAECSG